MPEKITPVPCGQDGTGKISEIIGYTLGFIISFLIIGVVLVPILAISYIIPVINIPAILLISLRDQLGLGFWKGICVFICLLGGVGGLMGLCVSCNALSKRSLSHKLHSANFGKVKENTADSCHWCEHHEVILLDKTDPDNSERLFYCNYFPFKFKGTDSPTDLCQFTCDYYKSDGIIEGLVSAIKPSQSTKQK